MELFERYEELNEIVNRMNREAVSSADVPYIRLHDYVHYCDVATFFHAYTRRLRLPEAVNRDMLAFCYRDTLELKPRLQKTDLYNFTFAYFKGMTYRTGNLDTPDDCVEKIDLDIFNAYRGAREKEWRHETLTPEEQLLLEKTVREAMAWEMGNLPGMKPTR